MKTLSIGLLAIVVLCTFSMRNYASEDKVEVPDAVKAAFSEKYKGVTPKKWGVEDEGGKKQYEAQWTDSDGVKHEVEFDAAGAQVLEAHSIKLDQLPKAVVDAIENKYPKSKLSSAKAEETKEKFFEVTFKDSHGKKITVDVSTDGSKITEDND